MNNTYQNGQTNGTHLTQELQRVVITGWGAITPLALTATETWDRVINSQSGIDYVKGFDTADIKTKFAGEIKGFDAANYMTKKEARRTDRCIQYAIAAADEAIQDSDLHPDDEDPQRVGVLVSSGIGGLQTTIENHHLAQEKGVNRVGPFMIPNMLIDSTSGKLAIKYNMQGINHAVVSACSTGSLACGEAFEIIRRGDADVMLTGGTESIVVPIMLSGFDVMGAHSRFNEDPAAACKPFDAERDGFVMSDGSVVIVMESLAHAEARGAKIYAEVIGYGCSADAYHMAAPHSEGRGAVDAMRMALRKAADYGVQPSDVDYINAHGTATRLNDKGETLAIKETFGEHAYQLAVSSTKSMTGHLLSGAGALEAMMCAKAIETSIIPPTINLNTPDPDCDLDYTPNVARKAEVNVTLSNNFGFGGHNACIMLRKYTH